MRNLFFKHLKMLVVMAFLIIGFLSLNNFSAKTTTQIQTCTQTNLSCQNTSLTLEKTFVFQCYQNFLLEQVAKSDMLYNQFEHKEKKCNSNLFSTKYFSII